jgi:uncharacterized protein
MRGSRVEAAALSQTMFVRLALTLLLTALGVIGFWASRTTGAGFQESVFFTALLIGFAAQMVDGALGMAYGITATSFLLSSGVPPVAATAAVHISEAFTTGASGLSHWRMGNVNRALFKRLLVPGVLGAVVGVLLVTSIDGQALRPWVSGYLLLMGAYLVYKAFKVVKLRMDAASSKKVGPLAFVGAFVDSVGGGGWGPVVTTTLLGSGHEPKTTIGSVNAAEFFITLASGFSFALLVGVSHWETVAGLILGGLLAAPLAARLTRRLPIKALMVLVGGLIMGLSIYNLVKALG